MTVCYFGTYNPDYVRNRVLMLGLQRSGVVVRTVNARRPRLGKYGKLWSYGRQIARRCDAIVVGFPGHAVMPLARLVARWAHVPLLFDAFTSLYDAMATGRRRVTRRSLAGHYYRLLDWSSCRLADVVLLDTKAHADELAKLARLPRQRFHHLYVSTDIAELTPAPVPPKPAGTFVVHFHGHYTAFQGADVIVRAAKLLEHRGVRFNLIGRGEEYPRVWALAHALQVTNVSFTPDVAYAILAGYVAQSDLCLGVFGGGNPRPVIPNKVVEAMALGKPVLSAHLPAMDELFTPEVHISYCRPDDPEHLAERIEGMRANAAFRQRLAQAGQQLFEERLTPSTVGEQLRVLIDRVVSGKAMPE